MTFLVLLLWIIFLFFLFLVAYLKCIDVIWYNFNLKKKNLHEKHQTTCVNKFCKHFFAVMAWPCMGYLKNPLAPQFNFFKCFFYRPNYKIGGPMSGQCWLTVCDAGLTFAKLLVHVYGSGKICNVSTWFPANTWHSSNVFSMLGQRGTASKRVEQHWNHIGWMPPVCWEIAVLIVYGCINLVVQC